MPLAPLMWQTGDMMWVGTRGPGSRETCADDMRKSQLDRPLQQDRPPSAASTRAPYPTNSQKFPPYRPSTSRSISSRVGIQPDRMMSEYFSIRMRVSRFLKCAHL